MQCNSTASPPSGKPTKPAKGGCQPGVKPEKPYADFPLFPHATKRWAKKIRGQFHYFGPWDDPDGALARYEAQKDALHSGKTPRADTSQATVKDAVNAFLNDRVGLVELGKLSARTLRDYKETTELLVSEFGKRRVVTDLGPADFSRLHTVIAERWGLHRVAKHIQYTRSVFKFALDNLVIEMPVNYGSRFKRPSLREFRLEKASKPPKLFTADEIKNLLKAATPSLHAMILLGINAGFGNADCALLPIRAVNLDTGWLNYPRPKTGLPRRCPLMPETLKALRAWLAVRPASKDPDDAELMFTTAKGNSWMKETSDNPVSKEMRKLMKVCGLNGARNFYSLRHTHRTISDECCDQRASGFIMGQADPAMAAVDVERIKDERLQRIVDHLHAWLFAPAKKERKASKPRLKIVAESA